MINGVIAEFLRVGFGVLATVFRFKLFDCSWIHHRTKSLLGMGLKWSNAIFLQLTHRIQVTQSGIHRTLCSHMDRILVA